VGRPPAPGVSARNVALVERSVAAINAGEFSEELHESLCTSDFWMTNPSTAVTEKAYRGAAGVREWIADFTEVFGTGVRFELEEILAGDDGFVVAGLRWSGEGAQSGAPLVLRWISVWWFRDGKMSRAAGYRNRRDAFEAVGLDVGEVDG
jgi:ketosteroid isomerase-like protein